MPCTPQKNDPFVAFICLYTPDKAHERRDSGPCCQHVEVPTALQIVQNKGSHSLCVRDDLIAGLNVL